MTTTEFKALDGTARSIEQTEKGDLIVSGYAAVWHGEDRVGDSFDPQSFHKSIQEFLSSQATLLHHHDKSQILGRVLELEPDDYGLRFRARVDAAIANDPRLRTIYEQVRRKTINGVSVGGRFTRSYVGGKPTIVNADLFEVSLTAQPMDRRPRVLSIEQKALRDPGSVQGQLLALGRRVELLGVAMSSYLRIAAALRGPA